MNDLITAAVIGAISQILFFNLTKDTVSGTNNNINMFLYVGVSVFAITSLYSFSLKNKNLSKLLVEALVVGIMTLVVGKLTSRLVAEAIKMYSLDSTYATEIILILTGVLIHLLCEFSGINKWYISNGVAAM
jgi:fucose permease